MAKPSIIVYGTREEFAGINLHDLASDIGLEEVRCITEELNDEGVNQLIRRFTYNNLEIVRDPKLKCYHISEAVKLAEKNQAKSASDIQVGGDHYKKFKIQPAEFCHVNKIGPLESSAIWYLCRWRDKGGFEDLDKAIHFIQLLKEYEV